MTAHTIPAPATARPPALLRATQMLLGLMGAVVVYGSVYFTVVAPPEEVRGVDWLVGAWALATGVAAVVLATRLARGDARVRRLATVLLASHVVFGVVKVVGYDEAEAATFIAVDLLLLALLQVPSVRRAFNRPS